MDSPSTPIDQAPSAPKDQKYLYFGGGFFISFVIFAVLGTTYITFRRAPLVIYHDVLPIPTPSPSPEPVPTLLPSPPYSPTPEEKAATISALQAKRQDEQDELIKMMDVSGWEKFESPELGINFRMPPGSRIEKVTNSRIVLHMGGDYKSKFHTPLEVNSRMITQHTIKDWFSTTFPQQKKDIGLMQDFTVDSSPAVKWASSERSPGSYFLLNGQQLLGFSMVDHNDYPLLEENIIDRVIKSITFR